MKNHSSHPHRRYPTFGFVLNSTSMTMTTEEQRGKIYRACVDLLKQSKPKIRKVASCIDLMVSSFLAVPLGYWAWKKGKETGCFLTKQEAKSLGGLKTFKGKWLQSKGCKFPRFAGWQQCVIQRSSNGTFSTELFSQPIQRVSIWTECFGEKLMKVLENKPTLPKQISTWDVIQF